MAEQLANSLYNPTTTLSSSCTNVAATISVVSAAEMPSTGNFRLRIDTELMLVTSRSGTTLTVTRGVEGTSNAAHSNAAQVDLVLTSGALSQYVADRQFGTATEVTIVDGEIDATGLRHILVHPEGGVDDQIDRINGAVDGQVLVIGAPDPVDITIVTGSNLAFAGVRSTGEYVIRGNANNQVIAVYSDWHGFWMIYTTGFPDTVASPDGTNVVEATDDRVAVALAGSTYALWFAPAAGLVGNRIGFFGKANDAGAVEQPATPVTLGNVISALQSLGLVA